MTLPLIFCLIATVIPVFFSRISSAPTWLSLQALALGWITLNDEFSAHTLLLGLLGMVCGFLAYWGTRLEQRVDELKARQCLLAEEMHKSYVPREDCRERTAQILGGLERADEKLDRIADAIRTGGR